MLQRISKILREKVRQGGKVSNMKIREISHVARAAEWQERIRMCRSSGMSVTCWCAENQISPKTYYRWERICLAEAAERLGYTGSSTQGLVKIDPGKLSNENNNPNMSSITTAAELVIRCGQVSIEINSEMPVARIADLVSALNSHV